MHGKVLGLLSTNDLKQVITKAIAAYNREVKEVNVMVFAEVHISMISFNISLFYHRMSALGDRFHGSG